MYIYIYIYIYIYSNNDDNDSYVCIIYIYIYIYIHIVQCNVHKWGFDYNFTDYNFKKTLEFKNRHLMFAPLARYVFELLVLFETRLGEIVVKSPHRR